MLNRNNTGLLIFDHFQIDFTLPKWQERLKAASPDSAGSITTLSPFPNVSRDPLASSSRITFNSMMFPSNENGGMAISGIASGAASTNGDKKMSLWDMIFNRKKITKKRIEEQVQKAISSSNFLVAQITPEIQKTMPEMSVEEFFKSVKYSAEELTIVEERLKTYEDALSHLKNSGQLALYELMCQEMEIHKAETQLYAIGHKKIITETNIVEFAGKSDKKLKIDWVQNFTRLIPKKIIDVKVKMDSLHIFDNYVVLHYDPDGKGSELTQQEKAAKKDPILFGVMAGSTRLYFIGDWIDEYCDLTFDKLVDQLGSDAITANDISATISIPEIK